MADYTAEIAAIRQARTHQDILDTLRTIPAAAADMYAISLLYSGQILKESGPGLPRIFGQAVANDIVHVIHANMIDHTPRGLLLLDENVDKAIEQRSIQIDLADGVSLREATRRAGDFRFGSAAIPSGNFGSLDTSAWGQASHDFATSLRGDVAVVATVAPHERIFAMIELPTVMAGPPGLIIAGQPADALRRVAEQRGAGAAVELAQERFREAAHSGGIYVSTDGREVHVSREAATLLRLPQADRFPAAAELAATGLRRGEVVMPELVPQAIADQEAPGAVAQQFARFRAARAARVAVSPGPAEEPNTRPEAPRSASDYDPRP